MSIFHYGFREPHTGTYSGSVEDGGWGALCVEQLGGKDHRVGPLDRGLSTAAALLSTCWWKLPIPFRGREPASNKLNRVNVLGGGQRRSIRLRFFRRDGKLKPYFLRYTAEQIEQMRSNALTQAKRTGDWAVYRLEITNMPSAGDFR